MAVVTLNSLVLKTVMVSDLNRLTPADRIGQGKVVFATFPAAFLSPYPAPEHGPRTRTGLADEAMPPTPGADGSTGCLSPGLTARLVPPSMPATWQASAKRTAAVGSTQPATVTSRESFPRPLSASDRIGRDCQSPDRNDPHAAYTPAALPADRVRDVLSAKAAGK